MPGPKKTLAEVLEMVASTSHSLNWRGVVPVRSSRQVSYLCSERLLGGAGLAQRTFEAEDDEGLVR